MLREVLVTKGMCMHIWTFGANELIESQVMGTSLDAGVRL
jgi:hypothetical protein